MFLSTCSEQGGVYFEDISSSDFPVSDNQPRGELTYGPAPRQQR